MMYGAKSFGTTHFFKTEDEREAWIQTLPEWEQKYVERWTTILKRRAVK